MQTKLKAFASLIYIFSSFTVHLLANRGGHAMRRQSKDALRQCIFLLLSESLNYFEHRGMQCLIIENVLPVNNCCKSRSSSNLTSIAVYRFRNGQLSQIHTHYHVPFSTSTC